MRKLLEYFLKKRLQIILIVSVILMIIVYLVCRDPSYVRIAHILDAQGKVYQSVERATNLPFGWLAAFSIVLSVIITVSEFSFKMKKISVDQMYSMPIKREKLYITKYLVGLIEIVIPLTASFLLMVTMILTSNHVFKVEYFIPYFLGLIFLTSVVYTTLVFIFTRANSVVDGIILIGLYSMALPFLLLLIKLNTNWLTGIDVSSFSIFSPVIYFNTFMDNVICGDFLGDTRTKEFIWSLVVGIIISVIMAVLFFILLKKQKAEDAEQITDSAFGYNLMIPLYTFSGFVVSLEAIGFSVSLVVIGTYIGYVIKNRSFKPTKKDLIAALISLVAAIIFVIITNSFVRFTN